MFQFAYIVCRKCPKVGCRFIFFKCGGHIVTVKSTNVLNNYNKIKSGKILPHKFGKQLKTTDLQ